MANQRIFLWAALALVAWLLYDAWTKDYHSAPRPTPAATTSQPGAPAPTQAPGLGQAAPGLPATQTPAPGTTAPVPGGTPVEAPADAGAGVVRVVTDVVDVDISLQGGEFVRLDLLQYVRRKGEPGLVRLFEKHPGAPQFVFQSGLTSGTAGGQPDHLARFTAPATEYKLQLGQDTLVVPLTWTGENGVTVTKTYTFRRGRYDIPIAYAIENRGTQPWRASSYLQFLRDEPAVDRSMFDPESYAFSGPAVYDGEKYRKLDIEDDEDRTLSAAVTDGWTAAMQHHFVAAAVPESKQSYAFRLQVQDRRYQFTAVSPPHTVEPGGQLALSETLVAGPKLQEQLEDVHPELSRVADYGKLWFLAKPLFIALEWVHSVVGNWGWAIVIVTALLKLLFYPLSEASGRSMAKMRALAPRIKNIQERYKDDREQLGRAMMELYKREKINPLAGCLPILIQIPVFLAFYWVLLESVEMRQAPFMLWIDDLSSRDPFFILPLLMGAAMFGQYKLNPAPPDPVQAKVFAFMPIIMTVMFAWFPSGLVLYWLTNTVLSIAQQWRINRVVEAAAKKQKTE
jgi:YidC/Oxa1 family membrane protein insertase